MGGCRRLKHDAGTNVCMLVRKVAPGGVLAAPPPADVLAGLLCEPERHSDVT